MPEYTNMMRDLIAKEIGREIDYEVNVNLFSESGGELHDNEHSGRFLVAIGTIKTRGA